jgi:hypothetical protein
MALRIRVGRGEVGSHADVAVFVVWGAQAISDAVVVEADRDRLP